MKSNRHWTPANADRNEPASLQSNPQIRILLPATPKFNSLLRVRWPIVIGVMAATVVTGDPCGTSE